jgi:hypothetical protein
MLPNELGVFDADIDYALRMIRTGCATIEQASRTCGIPVAILHERLGPTAPGVQSIRTKVSRKASA